MKNILYVEDNAIVTQAYGNVLRREGFNVDVAEDGLAAMKKLAATKPDLVLLDLIMPKINGTDVLKYIRSTPMLKSTPVIMLSDGSMADLAQGALAIGVEGALLKSRCNPQILLETIREVLGEGAPANPASTHAV
ncbi:MAG TPA: response regulator [Candidatus Baltobacteraceae bacterium]|nr:response regulator [Candidatus Baltobacteraceae bacterium]